MYKSKIGFIIFALITILILGSCNMRKNYQNITPPIAKKIPKELTIHGDTRIDNYYWMNNREDQKVLEYLHAENAYKDGMMKHTEDFQKKLYEEIVGRIKQDDNSVPYKENGYYYYYRYEKGAEYPIYARKKENTEGKEEVLLNVPELAKGYKYYRVTGLTISTNNNILAFAVDTVSRRKYTIYFKDLKTGELLSDNIPNTTGSPVWANDNKTIFYTTKDNTLRAFKVWKHRLGNDISKDEEIFHETDNTFEISVDKTLSGKYILLSSYSTLSGEEKLIDADNPEKPYVVFQKRKKDHEYYIYHHIDKFYILTNYKAKNFRLMQTSVDKPSLENWKEVIPNRDDVLLEDVDVFKNFLVLTERINGISQIRVINLQNKSDHYIKFDEKSFVAYPSGNHEFETETLRFRYSSLTTPFSTYDYNMISKDRELLKIDEIGGDFNSDNYISERVWVTARDGEKIPMSIVYRKGIKKNGNNPLLQYAYGSYGSNVDPYFSSSVLSLLDRGFVYAISHIRGSSTMGRKWYENGKLLKKKNTFTDFIDCSKYLIEHKYTNSNKLFAEGASAGGLLIGAISNMQPDLYKGLLAEVPWVDVVTTMLDESIPLTTGEFDEWGNPKNKEYYDYMLSYSPYDNVEAKNYPAMLVTTGLHDSQVQYYEPTKWVAKLRDMKTDDNLLLLDIDMSSGHGGSSGRFKRYKRTALSFAFMFDLVGIKE